MAPTAGPKVVQLNTATFVTKVCEDHFNAGTYSDLTIISGNKRIPVHKVIVCAQSCYFKAMCESGFKESTESEIELQEDDSKTLMLMVNMMYGRELVLEEATACVEQLVEVFQVAEKYQVDDLCNVIASSLVELLDNSKSTEFISSAIRIICLAPTFSNGNMVEFGRICNDNITALKSDGEFMKTLRNCPSLAMNLLEAIIRPEA